MSELSEEEVIIYRLSEQLKASRSSTRNLISQRNHLTDEVEKYKRMNNQLLVGQAKQQSDIRDQALGDLTQQIREKHQSKSTVIKQREQQARQLEDEVKSHLNQLVVRIAAEHNSDISLIQSLYSMEVEHVIRAATTSSYIVGLNYVGARKKRLHHMFLTASDVDKIKNITTEFTDIFWRRIKVVLHQKDTVQSILKSARFSHRSTLNMSNLVTSLAVKIVTKSIAVATIVKVNALRSLPESKSNIKSAQATETITWSTQHDELVCPLCQSLDGMEWNSDDPNLLVPPDDAHDNCRCRLDISGASDLSALLPTALIPGIVGTELALQPTTTSHECKKGYHWDDNLQECVKDKQ